MARKITQTKFLAWLPVIAIGLFILAPQLALFAYAFISRTTGNLSLSGVQSLVEARGFGEALGLSLLISVLVVAVLILVLVPAIVAVHLWAPKLKGILNVICTLPLVVPTIALVAGLMGVLRAMSSGGRGTTGNQIAQFMQMDSFPIVLIGSYVVLALPFTYRSINSGLSAIPLKVLFEASESLGGGVWHTIRRVVVPNIRGSVIFSAFFAFALSIGEYTMAATMGYSTLSVWMTILSTSDFRSSITLALLSNIVTWALLAFATIYAGRIGKKPKRRRIATSTPTDDQASSPTESEASSVVAEAEAVLSQKGTASS